MTQVQTELFDFIPYYNTTKQSGEKLKEYQKKASCQDVKVLDLFRRCKKLTPSECWKFFDPSTPITSIRRSITNLTKEGKLEKTSELKTGIYSRPEYIWRSI